MTVNLDDITKTSFCIPFKKPPSNKHSGPTVAYDSPFPPTPHPSRDLPHPTANELRFEAYRVAWSRCLSKIQEIITDLQKSTVDEVVNAVTNSDLISNPCTTRLPGLPCPELPIIAVTNTTLGPSFLHKIITELETKNTNINAMDTDMDDPASPSTSASQPTFPHCLVLHCRSADFSNVTAGMKAVVAGFVDKGKDLQCGERKAATSSTSLAGYDITYLEAWYKSLTASTRKGKEVPNKLVVILHDFEQFDPCVMQDVFHICSQALRSVPITFILSLSSPLPNYLNAVYPATTLSLMKIRTINAPGGARVLSKILRKTFFDVDFDPEIVIGPSALEFLQDFFTRQHSSIDVLLTVLQLAHLKHFTSDPLTALVQSTPSTRLLTQHESAKFVESLGTRLGLGLPLKAARNDKSQPVTRIIEAIDKARETFRIRARDMRVGFGIMCSLQAELRRAGYKGLEWASDGAGDGGGVDVMLDLLRGRLGRDVRLLGTIVKKLKVGELQNMLDRLSTYLFDLPAQARVRDEEQEARTHLILLRARLSQDDESPVIVAGELSEWLKEYLSDKLRPLEDLELWDVWYTRNTPPPSELLDPSVRACIVAGLLRPYEYAKDLSAGASSESTSGPGDAKEKGKARPLWELPDTSILFRRYQDSGRMINVFDWFESFKGVLEMQRRCGLVDGEGEGEVGKREMSRSPRKKGKGKERKSKGKGKEKEIKEAVMEEEENEEWKLEVQARFIRALHELDYLGLVKHTGRKRDHVLRTLFEVGDEDEDDD